MADDSKYPTRIAPYGLRMPPDLKARVEASAVENQRSLNAEIVATLLERYPQPPPDEAEAEFLAFFEAIPKEERDKFLHEWLAKNVTDEDIRDGLIPGIRLKE